MTQEGWPPCCGAPGCGGLQGEPRHSCSLAAWTLQGLPWWLSGKESACSAGTRVPSLAGEDPLEEEMAPHSSIPAWRIPWTGAWWATVYRVAELDTAE